MPANVSPPIDLANELEGAKGQQSPVAQSQALNNKNGGVNASSHLGRATELRGVDIGNDFRQESVEGGTNVTASNAYPGNKLGPLSEEAIAEREERDNAELEVNRSRLEALQK